MLKTCLQSSVILARSILFKNKFENNWLAPGLQDKAAALIMYDDQFKFFN